jgi:hypothetical protein
MRQATILITILIFSMVFAIEDNSMTQLLNPQLSGIGFSIPKSINFQGYLYRDGNPMDTTMNMWFGIYDLPSGGSILFQQTINNVEVVNGWFTVTLDNIPNSVFPVSGPTRYLEVKAPSTGPALEPRLALVSVGYSYHAITSDSAETANDIKDGAVTMAKINPAGSTAGQAITSTGSGTAPNWSNPTPGQHGHLGETWTTTTDDIGLKTLVDRNTSSTVCGRQDSVVNSGDGSVYGGRFYTGGAGFGKKYGVYVKAYSPPGTYWDDSCVGVYGEAYTDGNNSAGGGCFKGYNYGPGRAYGVRCEAYSDTGGGSATGGRFEAGGWNSGFNIGVYSDAWCPGPGTEYSGYFIGDHMITGSKSAAVKIDNNDWRLLYCQESPELWFEDFGEGQLNNGQTHIELEPIFLKTVTISKEHPIKVFVQLNDNCNGVYVKRGNTGFDVIELQNGKSNAQFTYRVVAKRTGYENLRLKKMEPGTNPEELRAEFSKEREKMERERNKTR